MFCYKCGNKIEDNTKFCPACGARQEAVSYTDKPSEVPAVKPAEPAKASKPKNRKKLYTGIIAGACVIVVVAAAIACIHFIWPLEDENTPQEEQLLQNSEQDSATGVNDGGNAISDGLKVQGETGGKVQENGEKTSPENNGTENENAPEEPESQTAPAVETMSPIRQQVEEEIVRIEIESDAIKQELSSAMTQADMNKYSGELYKLWDDYINVLWGYLGDYMSEADFSALTDEQLDWIYEKEAAVEEAGNEVKGGTMEPLVRNSVAAEWTEQRVYELIEYLP